MCIHLCQRRNSPVGNQSGCGKLRLLGAFYTKTPIKPGEKGEIKETYNGKGAFPGHFKKTITVRTNGVTELTRLYIEGVMEEAN